MYIQVESTPSEAMGKAVGKRHGRAFVTPSCIGLVGLVVDGAIFSVKPARSPR